MRKVVAYLLSSLDGVVGSLDQWAGDYVDEGLYEELGETIGQQDAVLLGRISYQDWAGYWPTSDHEPFSSFINNTQKYVISSTLDTLEWQHSTLIRGDLKEAILKLKQQPGRDIGIHASPTLVESLVALDLVDELRLLVFPAIAGSGRRLFQDELEKKPLKLMQNKKTPSGIVRLIYEFERKS